MGAAENLNIVGKDWLTVDEAAHYCGVSESQFRKNAVAYGLTPKRFMGKQLYEKSALYAAIYGSQEWQGSRSTGATASHTSTGAKAASGIVRQLGGSASEMLRKYEQRRKRS